MFGMHDFLSLDIYLILHLQTVVHLQKSDILFGTYQIAKHRFLFFFCINTYRFLHSPHVFKEVATVLYFQEWVEGEAGQV